MRPASAVRSGDGVDVPAYPAIPHSRSHRVEIEAGMRSLIEESLQALGQNQGRFVAELLGDLQRRHPHVLAGRSSELDATAVGEALREFVADRAPGDAESDDPDAVADLADSIMKTFALCLGRAAWKPAMALEWNSVMRERGGRLLDALRDA